MKNLDLSKVLWLGGSPCSGKTTISDILSEQFNISVYHIDDYAFSKHLEHADYIKHPSMCKLREEGWDKIMAQPSKRCVEFWKSFYFEDFEMIINDILKLKSNNLTIIEGVCIMPEILFELHQSTINNAIFLLPSEDFFRRNMVKREKLMAALQFTPDPKSAFENIISVYMSMAEDIYNNATRFKFEVLKTIKEDDLIVNTEIVINYFKLKNNFSNIRHSKEDTGSDFSEQILSDLIAQGLSGQELIIAFEEMNKKIVLAMDKLINDSDNIAKGGKKAATMADIFGKVDAPITKSLIGISKNKDIDIDCIQEERIKKYENHS